MTDRALSADDQIVNTRHRELLDRVAAWIDADVDAADQAELRELLASAADPDPQHGAIARTAVDELADRFAADLQFGTAGLRGAMAAGPNRMNRAVVIRAAAGLAAYLRQAIDPTTPADVPGAGVPRVVVGYDARHHSAAFASDTAGVLTADGIEVFLLPSALPTPVLAFAVRHLGADAGVMVTASHNPPQDNGYKVYLGGRVVRDFGQGAQIVPPYDAQIAAGISAAPGARDVPRTESGWTVLDTEIVDAYVASILSLTDGAPRDLRIVTTALHGVGGETMSRILAGAGFTDVIPVAEQYDPDPNFPTVSFPNPEEPGAIDLALGYAADSNADLVIANDPDADRCAVAVKDPRAGTYQGVETAASNGWRMLHGDEVGALLGEAVAQGYDGAVAETGVMPTLACSIVSSRLLGRIASAHGLGFAQTLTGFKWISRANGLVFGYEEALGYCVDPGSVRDKDGMSAGLLLAQLAGRLKAQGRTLVDALDDLARAHGLHLTDQVSARFTDLDQITATMGRLRSAPPQTLAGAQVTEVVDLATGPDGLPPTDGVRLVSADGTRVVVRPSGTEPKVKCYLEVIVALDSQATFDEVSRARKAAGERLDRVAGDLRSVLGI